MPFFSVIVPTWNRPHLLSEALRGIEAQTFKDYEVIIVADRAGVETVTQVQAVVKGKKFTSRLLTISLDSVRKGGPSVTRNIGLQEAKGNYCAFCDDDDLWIDNRHLEVAYDVMTHHPDIDYFFGNQVGYLKDDVKISDWLPHVSKNVRRFNRVNEDTYIVSVEQLVDPTAFPHLNATIISKELAKRIGGFWEDIRYSEDFDFFLRAVDKAKKIVYRDVPVSRHNIPDRNRKENASSMLTHIEKQVTYIAICNHIRITCNNRAVLKASNKNAGYAFKRVSESMDKQGHRQAAWLFARQALATTPTLKWLIYTLLLGAKYYFGPNYGSRT